MPTGTAKWFNAQKGVGFIAPDGSDPDAFVHVSAVERAGLRGLTEGRKVQYDLVTDPRRGKSSAENLKAL
jgi:cold shock protein